MGSGYKVGSSSHSQRGKSYALILLLGFMAAILGVMVLHKIRENRVFSILVNQKDHELLALHLLFQREKELSKAAWKKIEEMKTEVYSLRSKKLELHRRLFDMESMISSLRDERKVIESVLEEENEIKMLTVTEERTNSSRSSRFVARAVRENDTAINFNSTKEVRTFRLEVKGQVASTKPEDQKKEDAENGGSLIRREENIENRASNQGSKVTEEKINETSTGHEGEQKTIGQAIDVSDNVQNQENRGYSSLHRAGLKLEKSNMKRHFKGKSERRRIRNRRLGHSLYNKQNDTQGLEDQLALSDRQNHIREPGEDSQAREDEPNKKDKGQGHRSSKRPKPNIASIKDDDWKQKSVNNQSENQGVDERAKKMKKQGKEVNKHGDDNLQQKEAEKEEAEAEEIEDAETREPEIDKTDIQRFAESETDEESESEEAEF